MTGHVGSGWDRTEAEAVAENGTHVLMEGDICCASDFPKATLPFMARAYQPRASITPHDAV